MIQYTKAYIQSLLDKYMEGTTTLEEEDILHQYFSHGDVPEEWEDYRLLFAEIDSMRPKTSRRWMGWSAAAAAIVAGILYLTVPASQSEHPQDLTAKADTTAKQQPQRVSPDTMPKREQQTPPAQTKKRKTRKVQPTIHDYDKAYVLMAEAAKEQQQAEREMEQAQKEILHAQLTAAGYVAIQQEDGTIIYTNEPNNYFAYEE